MLLHTLLSIAQVHTKMKKKQRILPIRNFIKIWTLKIKIKKKKRFQISKYTHGYSWWAIADLYQLKRLPNQTFTFHLNNLLAKKYSINYGQWVSTIIFNIWYFGCIINLNSAGSKIGMKSCWQGGQPAVKQNLCKTIWHMPAWKRKCAILIESATIITYCYKSHKIVLFLCYQFKQEKSQF